MSFAVLLCSHSNNQVKFWDFSAGNSPVECLATLDVARDMPTHVKSKGAVSSVAFDAAACQLAIGFSDGEIVLYRFDRYACDISRFSSVLLVLSQRGINLKGMYDMEQLDHPWPAYHDETNPHGVPLTVHIPLLLLPAAPYRTAFESNTIILN